MKILILLMINLPFRVPSPYVILSISALVILTRLLVCSCIMVLKIGTIKESLLLPVLSV